MTEDLIAMARQVGFHVGSQFVPGADEETLTRFAALIEARAVARTREECAKVCENIAAIESTSLNGVMLRGMAAAIRALGERT